MARADEETEIESNAEEREAGDQQPGDRAGLEKITIPTMPIVVYWRLR